MSVQSKELEATVSASESKEMQEALASLRRRRIVIMSLRAVTIVVLVGGWELLAQIDVIDPFFWGKPSGIWNQLVKWVTNGTAQGPLWNQIAATLKEAVLGFLIGVILGVIFGVILGRNRFLADVLGPFIKAANSIPGLYLDLFSLWGLA